MSIRLKISVLVLICWCSIAGAEIVTGSGQPQVQMAVMESHELVLHLTQDSLDIIGRADLTQGYGEAVLDAVDSTDGTMLPNWGRFEAVMGCDWVDVVVYQNDESQGEHEALVQTVAVTACQ